MSRPLKVFTWFLLGTWLLQAAWILAVPPFRGLDEHEHAFKAAAVARGDWSPTHPASPDGWGERLLAPSDLVEAATPVCESLPYTTPDNCRGVRVGSGMHRVASSAARYNPSSYLVMGTAALPFEGAAALYAMRIAGAFACSVLLGWAAALAARRSSTAWPLLCLMAGVTPVVLYSTAVAAPNGLELGAAALLWSSFLAIHRDRRVRVDLPLVSAMVTSGVVLASARTLGPLWLGLIVAAGLLLVGRRRVTTLAQGRRARAGALVVAGATAAGLAWSLSARTNSPGSALRVSAETWELLPARLVLWVFQSVAAFPARDEIAPLAVYVIVFLLWAAVVLLGVRCGDRRLLLVAATVAAVSAALPSAATLVTYEAVGDAWQGRYGYPLAMGLVLVWGASSPSPVTSLGRRGATLVGAAVTAAIAVANLVSVVDVARGERSTSPLAGSTAWWDVPDGCLALLALAGGMAWWAAAAAARPPAPSDRRAGTGDQPAAAEAPPPRPSSLPR